MNFKLIPALLLAAICLVFTPQTQADGHDSHGFSGAYGYGHYGLHRSLYGLGKLPVPPYYALHPPVYYSHPEARSYGTSPFACPCGDYSVTSSQKSGVLKNPYYVPKAAEEVMEETTAGQTARMILNPFVQDRQQIQVSH